MSTPMKILASLAAAGVVSVAATAAAGAYTVNVANTAGSGGARISVTYLLTATDAAGNTSAVTTLSFLDAK